MLDKILKKFWVIFDDSFKQFFFLNLRSYRKFLRKIRIRTVINGWGLVGAAPCSPLLLGF